MSIATRLVRLALAPAARNRLSILIFHRVLSETDPLRPGEPTVAEFERELRWVKDWFTVMPLADAVRALKGGTLPVRALAITFDDGYVDNFDLAFPVLQRLGLPATVFVATGYLDGGVMFNDSVIEAVRQAKGEILDLSAIGLGMHRISDDGERRATVQSLLARLKPLPPPQREEAVVALSEACSSRTPASPMMRSEHVAALAASGVEIGAHTVSHPILSSIGNDEARREILDGKQRLEGITGRKVVLFAYPNGVPGRDYSAEHVEIVRSAGFEGAVSTAWGSARTGADPLQLPRFRPWDRTPLRYAARVLQTMAKPTFERVEVH